MGRRMSRVKSSGTIKMANLASRMRAEGKEIISLSMGEPDFTTPKHIIQAAKDALDKGETHYTPAPGIMPLREAVAVKSWEENGIPCEASNVLVTPTKHAVLLAMMAFIDEGDEVIMPDPSWVSYDPLANLAGGTPVPVALDDEFQLTPEALGEVITDRTKMVVLNSPSNPTGAVAVEEHIKGIADLANDHNLLVLSDEIYEQIIYDGKHLSIASLDGMFERTITLNGFSKAYAMTGWRLGWAVAPEHLFKDLLRVHTHSITCCTAFAQHGGLAALQGDQTPVTEMVQEFKARRDLAMDILSGIDGLECAVPQGAFYLFPRFKADTSSDQMCERIINEVGVAVTPGAAFGDGGEGHFRISYAASRETLKEALEKIGEVV